MTDLSKAAISNAVVSDAAIARLREAVDRPDAGERYVVHELLGAGGMGAVYRATDNVLHRDVALKALATEVDTPALATRLRREAQVLARLEHPGIVAVHDAGTLTDGRPYYVMRLVRGARIDKAAQAAGRGELLRLFLRACEAVAFANARGVIHRDIKPGNVMVGEYGEVLVLDWGVAKVVAEPDARSCRPAGAPSRSGLGSDTTTADGVAVGTPGYMAPEQLAGGTGQVDARTDVFGLGTTLRDLLEERTEPVPSPLRAIIARATATAPGERYEDANALAADVRAWLDAEPVSAYRETLWERALRFYRRNEGLILLVLAYLVVRLIILWWRGV
jgi:serine/threonine-protein kinase